MKSKHRILKSDSEFKSYANWLTEEKNFKYFVNKTKVVIVKNGTEKGKSYFDDTIKYVITDDRSQYKIYHDTSRVIGKDVVNNKLFKIYFAGLEGEEEKEERRTRGLTARYSIEELETKKRIHRSGKEIEISFVRIGNHNQKRYRNLRTGRFEKYEE